MQKEKYDLSNVVNLFYNQTRDIAVKDKLITGYSDKVNLTRRSFGEPYPRNRNISFINCEFEDDLTIEFADDTYLTFSDCIFKKKANIICNGTGQCEVSGGCLFNDLLNLSSQQHVQLILTDFICNGQAIIIQSDKHLGLNIKNVVVEQSIELITNNIINLDSCKSANVILRWAYNDQMDNVLNIEDSLIRFLSLETVSPLRIDISDSRIEKFNLGTKREIKFIFFIINSWVREMSIEPNKIESFTSLYSRFQKFKFTGKNDKSSFNVSSAQIKDLEFISFQNEGSVRFSNLTFDKNCSLTMASSDLNKVDFLKCSFSEGSFIFEDSKVNGLFLAETDFPTNVVNEEKELKWKQAQLAFGQISSAYNKQGDSVRSLDYHSREIEAHYNSIDYRKEFAVWLNLFLNKFSTNFGRNWLKGLRFTLGVAIIGFLLFYLSLDQTTCGNFDFISMGKIFFRYLNPIRITSIEEMLKDTVYTATLKSYFIDLISRIFLAYGYYQIIQAFRRYGKFQG